MILPDSPLFSQIFNLSAINPESEIRLDDLINRKARSLSVLLFRREATDEFAVGGGEVEGIHFFARDPADLLVLESGRC